MSWFGFEQVPSTFTVQQVSLDIYGCCWGSDITVTLNNGVTNDTVGPISMDTTYDIYASPYWVHYNVTSLFANNVTELNSAKLQIILDYIQGGLNQEFMIDGVCLQLYSTAYPITFGATPTTTTATANIYLSGASTTLYCEWYSVTNSLSSYVVYENNTGPFDPHNGTLSRSLAWGNYTIPSLDSQSSDVVAYYFGCNDSANNWYYTETHYINLQYSGYNATCFDFVGSSSVNGQRHSYGRATFWSPNTGLYWTFWSNTSDDSVYATSPNGKSWTYDNNVTDICETGIIGNGQIYYYLETRGSTDYIHYIFTNESQYGNIVTRMGQLNANSTITWLTTSDQIAVPFDQNSVQMSGGFGYMYQVGICTDPRGDVFVQYVDHTATSTYVMNITCSLNTNGVWSTDTADGYPKTLNTFNVVTSGYPLPMPNNNSVYCVMNPTSARPLGEYLSNNALQGLQDIGSVNDSAEPRSFSSVSYDGNVAFTFTDANTNVDFCWRNYTTGSWQVNNTVLASGIGVTWQGTGDFPNICYDGYDGLLYVGWWCADRCYFCDLNTTTFAVSQLQILLTVSQYQPNVDPNTILPYANGKSVLYIMNLVPLNAAGTYYEYSYVFNFAPMSRRVSGGNPHLLLTVEPEQRSYVGNQSVTLDVSVLNQLNPSLNSTLTLTVTGPGDYYYFDFQTINVTANSVDEYSFTWIVPNVAGTYYVEVGLVPPQLTAYDAAWLQVAA
jgi:hypothetical protein